MDFIDLAAQCAPQIHFQTMKALVQIESSFNPFAIGVVNGRLDRQPVNKEEAIATAKSLMEKNYNFSVGYAQVNRMNFSKYGLTLERAFEPCANIKAGAEILKGCFDAAKGKYPNDQTALRAALSCYYSGNFQTGLRPDFHGQPSYVEKVISAALGTKKNAAIPVHPVKPQENTGAIGNAILEKKTEGDSETASALVF